MLVLPFYSYDSVALTPGCKLSSFYHLSYNYLFFKCTHFSTFAICYRQSVCRLSVTFVHPTQAVEIFGNFYSPFGTLAIH